MHKTILPAAVKALRDIAETNGGTLPTTLSEVHALPAAYGIAMEPWKRGYKLVIDCDGPIIFYNPGNTPTVQKRGIIHELVEWLCKDEDRTLFDDLVGQELHQDGGDCPSDIHHQTAVFAETVYAEWLRRHT